MTDDVGDQNMDQFCEHECKPPIIVHIKDAKKILGPEVTEFLQLENNKEFYGILQVNSDACFMARDGEQVFCWILFREGIPKLMRHLQEIYNDHDLQVAEDRQWVEEISKKSPGKELKYGIVPVTKAQIEEDKQRIACPSCGGARKIPYKGQFIPCPICESMLGGVL